MNGGLEGRGMDLRSAAGFRPSSLWTKPSFNSYRTLSLGRQVSAIGGGVLSRPCIVAAPLEGDVFPRTL